MNAELSNSSMPAAHQVTQITRHFSISFCFLAFSDLCTALHSTDFLKYCYRTNS